MKTNILRNVVVLSTALMLTSALASPGAMFGIAYSFGGSGAGGLGITLKITSSNEANIAIASAGVSYYPLAKEQKFGADIGGGYLFENVPVVMSWDFLQSGVQLSTGYVNTMDDDSSDTPSGTGGGTSGGGGSEGGT